MPRTRTPARLPVRLAAAVPFSLCAAALSANIVINGDFSDNTAGGASLINMTNTEFNAAVAHATAFGLMNELDLWALGGGSLWALGMHHFRPGYYDAFSLELAQAVVSGRRYTLDCWGTGYSTGDYPVATLEFGITSDPAGLGTLAATAIPETFNTWTHFVIEFIAPAAGSSLSIRVNGPDDGYTAIALVSLVVTCPPDVNDDGFLDGIDYDAFNNWFESPDPEVQLLADYNRDGFVDGMDYDEFNNDFEAGC